MLDINSYQKYFQGLEGLPKIKDFLRLLHQLERKSEINQHLQDVIILKQYLNGRDCVLHGRYQRHSYFWGGIVWVDSTPEFMELNRVLDEHIARLTHKSKAVSRLENALSLLFSIYNTRVNPKKLLTITCFLANLSAAGAKPLPRSVSGANESFHLDYSFKPGHTALSSIDLPALIHSAGSYHVDIQPFPRETGLGIYPISSTYDPGNAITDIVISNSVVFYSTPVSLNIINIDDVDNWQRLQTYYPPGSIYNLVLQGELLFALLSSSGLLVLNVSVPSHIVEVGRYVTSQEKTLTSLAVENDTAVVYCQCPTPLLPNANSLLVLDLSDFRNISLAGRYDLIGGGRNGRVRMKEKIAFVAMASDGVTIVNVTVPDNPQLIISYDISGDVFDINLYHDIAYMSVDLNGLLAVNVSDFYDPVELFRDRRLQATDLIYRYNDRLYVVQAIGGINVYDISSPASPERIAIYDMPVIPTSMVKYNNFLLVGAEGIQIINMDRPALRIAGEPRTSLNDNIRRFNTTVQITEQSGGGWNQTLYLSVKINSSPNAIATISGKSVFPDQFCNFSLSCSQLFADADTDPLECYFNGNENPDGSKIFPLFIHKNALPPRLLNVYSRPSLTNVVGAVDVSIKNGKAYIATLSSLVHIYDLNNPAVPRLVADTNVSSSSYEVTLYDSLLGEQYAFISDVGSARDNTGGYQLMEVSNPTAPRFISSIPVNGIVLDIAVARGNVYIASEHQGLLITAPGSDNLFGIYHNTNLTGIIVRDADLIGFAAERNFGLVILDLTVSSIPRVVSRLETPHTGPIFEIYHLAQQGNMIYLSAGSGGFQIINVTDIENPRLIGNFSIGQPALDLAVSGQVAVVSFNRTDTEFGRTVFLNISDLTHPTRLINDYIPPGLVLTDAMSVALFRNTVQITTGYNVQSVEFNDIFEFWSRPAAADARNYNLSVTAIDAYGGVATTPFIFRVEGKPFLVIPIENREILAGANSPITFNSSHFSDPNNDVLTYDSTHPNWASFDPTNRLYICEPNATVRGNFTFNVWAIDGNNTNASTSFTVRVVPPMPTVSNNDSQTVYLTVASMFGFLVAAYVSRRYYLHRRDRALLKKLESTHDAIKRLVKSPNDFAKAKNLYLKYLAKQYCSALKLTKEEQRVDDEHNDFFLELKEQHEKIKAQMRSGSKKSLKDLIKNFKHENKEKIKAFSKVEQVVEDRKLKAWIKWQIQLQKIVDALNLFGYSGLAEALTQGKQSKEREEKVFADQKKLNRELNSMFLSELDNLKRFQGDNVGKISIFISYAWESVEAESRKLHEFLDVFKAHLERSGFSVTLDIKDSPVGNNGLIFMDKLLNHYHYVCLIGTPTLKEKSAQGARMVIRELENIRWRFARDGNRDFLLPLLLKDSFENAFPADIPRYSVGVDFKDAEEDKNGKAGYEKTFKAVCQRILGLEKRPEIYEKILAGEDVDYTLAYEVRICPQKKSITQDIRHYQVKRIFIKP